MKKICVNTICKNEIDNLDEWVESFNETDYFAILDTGSTDGTWEKLQKLAKDNPERFFIAQETFEPFYFDDARNEALKLVPKDTDWIVCVDLDERISKGFKNILNDLECEENVVNLYRRSITDKEISGYTPITRIRKNNNESKWYNHVHETLEDRNALTKKEKSCVEIYLEHFENNDPNKLIWYNSLLELQLQEDINDTRKYLVLNYLAYQNHLLKNHDKAWKYMQEAKKIADNISQEEKEKINFDDWWVRENFNMYKNYFTNKICIYAICKNESMFVDRWYESMKKADSIVVLDTGSTDDTVEKLRAHGITVEVKEIKPWRFDVARNEAMKLVPEDCNILISTDLDEVLEPGWADILRKKWIEGKHTRATYKYVWSHNSNGSNGREFYYNKIHNRDWVWRYPVHELLWDINRHTENYDSENELMLFNEITLHHYPDPFKSRGNYLPLLEQREAEYPDDIYGLIYLAHEYNYRGFPEKSNEKLDKVINYNKDKGIINSLEVASCYLFKGDNYTTLKQYNDAIYNYLKGIEIQPTYRELYLNLAKVYLELKQYDLAIHYIKQGLEKSYRHYTWLERDTSWTYEPYDLLCLAYYYNGDKLKSLGCAYKAYSINKDEERLKNNLELINNLIEDKDF